ncbi:DUF1217 domain-containing protein [Oceaniglobus roseus]|uniref:DUF1217 domain-containing protein n=1 Tax=Oceaniglobus roseus TaxID=1737570 RepID=UPI000C7EA6FB|nr:DUF1217 domain-containing protein [Kandeliimicrobium roseum]
MSFSPIVLGTGLAGYAFLARTRDQQQTLLAKTPQVARTTEHVLDRLKDVQTSDQLMADRTLLSVALGAFGLDEDLDNRAFIRRILDSDLSDDRSLANRLADKRYLALAKAFNFAGDGGPQLDGASARDAVAESLSGLRTADDLLRDRSLLRATLGSLGLEKDMDNTYFLKQVLESDPSDPASFARRLSDPRYTELAEAFGLSRKAPAPGSIYDLARMFDGRAGKIRTPEDILGDEALLTATLDIFGLRGDVDRTGFLTDVLSSDPTDPTSFANLQDDPRYAALAKVFDFAARAEAESAGRAFTSTLEKVVETVNARTAPPGTPAELAKDFGLMLATFEFFDLPARPDGFAFASRILTSDRGDPTSLVNVHPDPRYRAFADAMGMKEPTTERVYPKGFAEAIVKNYLDRQFEIQVGNSDPDMRIALSMARDLGDVVAAGLSNDSRWFGIMASKPLRQVFETVFRLPGSVGALDIDQQLGIFKDRAERFFGTAKVEDFLDGDRMDALRRRYLLQSDLTAQTAGTGTSIAQTLLAAAIR